MSEATEIAPDWRDPRRAEQCLDVHVGKRIRLRRILLRMSQEQLARELGVTFQQVQKYERGSNAVRAARLHRIAQVMRVEIGYFFEPGAFERPAPAVLPADGSQDATSAAAENREVADLFSVLSVRSRKLVVKLLRQLVDHKA